MMRRSPRRRTRRGPPGDGRRISGSASAPVAVVVGLDCITGLQTARILSERGVRVVGVAADPTHFACKTRACERIVVVDVTSDDLIPALEALGAGLDGRAVLFPCTDQSVMLISRHRSALAHSYHVVLPEHHVVELLMDKAMFARYAQEHGLPVPPTRFVATRDDAQRAAEELRFPVVVKPALKTSRWNAGNLAKVYRAENPSRLVALFDELSPWTDELIVQEWIAGTDADLFSCNCYFDVHGKPAVSFVARKLRQWPPGAGTSSLGEEVRDDEVRDNSLRLFRGVDYRGLGYVEFKRDRATGRAYIIEPNVGRPTGRSAIAEAGGVELLFTMYRDAIGRALPEARNQRYVGAKWIYFRHDLQSALMYVLRGELTLAEWWRSWRGPKVDAVWSRSDPAPFFRDWWQALTRVPLKTRRRARPASRPTEWRSRRRARSVPAAPHVSANGNSADGRPAADRAAQASRL